MTLPPDERPWYAEGDPWVLTQTEWLPGRNVYYETIFTQSNGYLGVRGYTEEVNPGLRGYREGYLAGVFAHMDQAALEQIQTRYPWPMLSMITLPEVFACEVELQGRPFRLTEGRVDFFSRSLDMRHGVLSRHLVWVSPTGLRTRLHFERFLSAAVPHLAMQRITLTPENWSGRVTLRFALDGAYPTHFRCGDRSFPHLRQDVLLDPRIGIDPGGTAGLTVATRGTHHTVSIASAVSGGAVTSDADGPALLRQQVEVSLEEGASRSVLHGVAVVSSRDDCPAAEVPAAACRLVDRAMGSGYDPALAASEAVWERRWAASDIVLDGPPKDQAYIRFSSFSLLQMAPFHTGSLSVPARAYAFNRYHGLYYWDSETFLMPCYLHTHPLVARSLLSFRHGTLDGARRTARHLGAPGACFPWMTDAEEGNEQGPWGIGDYLWHQNADIAYAVDQYVRASGDTEFMWTEGLEVIVESARFWMSRLEEGPDGIVHLHDTVGPDELDRHGRDNGYASLMARRHLRLAVTWLNRFLAERPGEGKNLVERLGIGPDEAGGWGRAADRMAAPGVPGGDFPLQDEFLLAKEPLDFEGLSADQAFAMRHTHRVVKQSDIILLMYLLQDEFTTDQMRAAYDFYEPMTLHFSSLSYNTHAILATKIGRDAQAYEYFEKAAGLDLDDLRGATEDGLHAAALAGTWQTVVYGFLGLRLLPDGIAFDPRIPEAWKAVSLKIAFRGFRLRLNITPTLHRVEVEGRGREGGPARLVMDGVSRALVDGLDVSSSPAALRGVRQTPAGG